MADHPHKSGNTHKVPKGTPKPSRKIPKKGKGMP